VAGPVASTLPVALGDSQSRTDSGVEIERRGAGFVASVRLLEGRSSVKEVIGYRGYTAVLQPPHTL